VWSTKTRRRDSDATAVTISVKCFNPLKRYLLSGNIFRKWLASYFLRTFNNNVISNSKSYFCNDTFTDVRLTSTLAKIFKNNTNCFYAVRISISLAILSAIFSRIGYFFQDLCQKTKMGVFF